MQFHLVPDGSHVLDVGCHTGILGSALVEKKHCTVKGIDLDLDALEVARERIHAVTSIDLEDSEWVQTLQSKGFRNFDAIIFGDVLEHTRQPAKILIQAKQLLSSNGRVIVSLPNVANVRIRLQILRGKFEYQDSGILDRTHLRFFTLKTARELLQHAGYRIIEERHTGYSLSKRLIDRFPGMLSAGFVFAAVPV
jgi:O-antigen biosynthesis protein